MFRVLFYLLGIVLVISILRGVVGVIGQFFGNLAGGEQQARKPAVPVSEALKRDPVCGAFVAPSAAVSKTVGDTTVYYCSKDCLDKHSASRASASG